MRPDPLWSAAEVFRVPGITRSRARSTGPVVPTSYLLQQLPSPGTALYYTIYTKLPPPRPRRCTLSTADPGAITRLCRHPYFNNPILPAALSSHSAAYRALTGAPGRPRVDAVH